MDQAVNRPDVVLLVPKKPEILTNCGRKNVMNFRQKYLIIKFRFWQMKFLTSQNTSFSFPVKNYSILPT